MAHQGGTPGLLGELGMRALFRLFWWQEWCKTVLGSLEPTVGTSLLMLTTGRAWGEWRNPGR